MTARVPVYDSGMLIALADRRAKAAHIHAGLKATQHRAIVIGQVLAQVWRPRPAVAHAIGNVLRDCTVPLARTAHPAMRRTAGVQAGCLRCTTSLDVQDWRRIGVVLGTAGLPAKSKPDAVDALVAYVAAQHTNSVIFTSDADDVRAYIDALNAHDVEVVPI